MEMQSKFQTYIASLKKLIKEEVVEDVFEKVSEVSVYSYTGERVWKFEETFDNPEELEDYLFERDITDVHGTLDELEETYDHEDFDTDDNDLELYYNYADWKINPEEGCYIDSMDPNIRKRVIRLWEAAPPAQEMAMALVRGPNIKSKFDIYIENMRHQIKKYAVGNIFDEASDILGAPKSLIYISVYRYREGWELEKTFENSEDLENFIFDGSIERYDSLDELRDFYDNEYFDSDNADFELEFDYSKPTDLETEIIIRNMDPTIRKRVIRLWEKINLTIECGEHKPTILWNSIALVKIED